MSQIHFGPRLSRYVFDGHFRTFARWLLHDGWIVENHRLVRVAPAAEEAAGIRDALIDELAASELDTTGDIRIKASKRSDHCIVRSSRLFRQFSF